MRYIAIQWEDDQLQVASARVESKRTTVDRAFQVEIPEPADDEKQTGEFLAQQLSDHSVPKGEAIVVIGRGQVEMRQFEVPHAPDEELPDIVRFQAKSQFAAMNEQWIVDFLPIKSEHSEQLTVLACALSPELLEQITTELEHAKLKVKHIVLRPFAVVDLLEKQLKGGPCQIIVDRHRDEVDLTVTWSDEIVLTRTVKVPLSYGDDDIAKLITREIRRTIASAQNQMDGREVQRAIVCGAESQFPGLESELQGDLGIETEFCSPFELVETKRKVIDRLGNQTLGFASVLGSLVEQSGQARHTIDFLNPRKRPEKKSNNSRKLLYGGLAAAAVLAVVAGGYFMLASRASEIKRLKSDLAMLEGDGRRDRNVQTLGEVAKIDDWKKGDVNWLEELYEITDRFPSPDDAIVTSFAGRVRNTPFDALISLRGKTSGTLVENAMSKSLRERPYRTSPGASPPTTDDPNFKRMFSHDLSLNIENRDINEILNPTPESDSPSETETSSETVGDDTSQ